MNKAKVGEIWLAYFPKVSINKNNTNIKLEKRPCLIVDDGQGFIIESNCDYHALKITSKEKKKYIEIKKWYEIGLKKKSFVRIELPYKVEQNQLIHKIGKVDKFDMYIYLHSLGEYINTEVIEKYKKGN